MDSFFHSESVGLILLDAVLDAFEMGLTHEEHELLQRQQVVSIEIVGDERLQASMTGRNKAYRVQFTHEEDEFGEDGVSLYCTCKKSGFCVHASVMSYLYLEAAWNAKAPWVNNEADAFEYLFEDEERYTHSAHLQACLDALFAAPASSAGKTRKKKGKAKAIPWWRTFLDMKDEYQREELLHQAFNDHWRNDTYWYPVDDVVNAIMAESNPIAALRLFVEKLEYVLFHYRGRKKKKPADLKKFLESEEAQSLEAAFQSEIHRANLLAWLARQESDHNCKIEAEWFEEALSPGLSVLQFRVLLTAKKLRRAPRNYGMLSQLQSDLERGKRSCSTLEADFLNWVARRLDSSDTGSGYRKDAPMEFLVTRPKQWLSEWASSGVLHWQGGNACQYDSEPAVLVAASDEEGGMTWRIRLPGDRAVAALLEQPLLVDLHAHRENNNPHAAIASYTRVGDALHPVETQGMPFHVLQAIMAHAQVPVEELRDSPGCLNFVERYIEGDPSHTESDYVAHVPVRPYVCLELDEDNRIRLSVQAVGSGDETMEWQQGKKWETLQNSFFLSGGKDLDVDAPVEKQDENPLKVLQGLTESGEGIGDGVLAMVPRREDVAALEVWLEAFVSIRAERETYPNAPRLLSWKLRKMDFAPFLALWAERPGGVSYYGNDLFAELTKPGRVPKIGLRIESSGVNLLKVSVEMEEQMGALPYDEVSQALEREETALVRLAGGALYRREELEAYRNTLDALAEMGVDSATGDYDVHALQLLDSRVEDALERAARDEANEAIRTRLHDFAESFEGIPENPQPKEVTATLRPYQQYGVNFMVWACSTFGGMLLADDMGLGKTVQFLAALVTLRKREKATGPSLVICPSSVCHNWQREAARFTPSLKVLILESGKERQQHLGELAQYDLVIKNFALARRDIDRLMEYEWFAVCIDEAQNIKNPIAEISKSVKRLKTKYRVAMTGTPIENRLLDLWSVMDFLTPGMFGSLRAFEKRLRGKAEAQLFRVMRSKLRPLMLRRFKSEVAPELPPRIEERLDCAMTDNQRAHYLKELKKTRALMGGMDAAVKGKHRIQMLAALTRLRQICCDPALMTKDKSDSESGKINELLELVPNLIAADHKILLFSQFVTMIAGLEERLKKAGIKTFVLTGRTRKRQELIDRFEAHPEPCVFLISLKAGGSGLNLTAASHVILFDPWWNPAVEEQAIDRSHRIGQDKTVVAYRLVTEDTIEERIMELQEKKRALVKNVLEEDAFNRTLNKDDFNYLLKEAEKEG
jgi:superfamily II DNA or RNA helicase